MQHQDLNWWRIVPCISFQLHATNLGSLQQLISMPLNNPRRISKTSPNPLSLKLLVCKHPHFVTISHAEHLSNEDLILNFLFIISNRYQRDNPHVMMDTQQDSQVLVIALNISWSKMTSSHQIQVFI